MHDGWGGGGEGGRISLSGCVAIGLPDVLTFCWAVQKLSGTATEQQHVFTKILAAAEELHYALSIQI